MKLGLGFWIKVNVKVTRSLLELGLGLDFGLRLELGFWIALRSERIKVECNVDFRVLVEML